MWLIKFQTNRTVFLTGAQKWFAGVSSYRVFEKSELKLQCSSEAHPGETKFGSSYRDPTVVPRNTSGLETPGVVRTSGLKCVISTPTYENLNIETGSYSEKSVQMKACLTTKMLLLLFLLLYNRCLTLKDFTFVVGLNKSEDLEQYSQLFVTRGVIRQRGIK